MCIIVKCENNERDVRSTGQGVVFTISISPKEIRKPALTRKLFPGFQEIESWLNMSGQVDLAHAH